MANAVILQGWSNKFAWVYRANLVGIPILIAVFLGLTTLLQHRVADLILVACACMLSFIWLARMFGLLSKQSGKRENLKTIQTLCETDLLPTLICKQDGEIIWQNQCATDLISMFKNRSHSAAGFLEDQVPDALKTVRRLGKHAAANGNFTERLIGLSGRVDVHIQQLGMDLLWRFDFKDAVKGSEQHEAAMLTVARKGTILFMNQSAKSLIGKRVNAIDRLFDTGLPKSGAIDTVMTVNGPVQLRVEVQQLKGDRAHIFLSPVAQESDSQNYALKEALLHK